MKITSKEKLFYTDATCGDVARWLRIVGFSVSSDVEPEATLPSLSADEGRLLLTRSATLAQTDEAKILLLPEGLAPALSLLREKGLLDPIKPFRRCPSCNQLLLFIPRPQVRPFVPPYVHSIHNRFLICPDCKRIYWSGTHLHKMSRFLDELFNQKDN